MPQSYKIYINDLALVVTNQNYFPTDNSSALVGHNLEKDIKGFFQWMYDSKQSNALVATTNEPELLMTQIKDELKLVIAAGGLVWNANSELLMIFRKGKWDLPKGKLELEEGIESAAVREVMEETGIENLQISDKLDNTYHIYKDHGVMVLKETHWYAMTSNYDRPLVPQAKEGITEVVWVKKEDLPSKMSNTYGSVRDILTNV